MPFDYVRPTDWAAAVQLMTQPGAVAKMGGCQILMRHRLGKLNARTLVGLNDLPGVSELTFSAAGACIGAGVTLWQLERSPELARPWPTLANVIGRIASPAIRSSATLVGNVAQGWNVGDVVPLLEVYDAELEVRGPSGQRRLSVSEYAKTPGTHALEPGELITTLNLPPPSSDFRVVYERFSLRDAFDLPLVSVALGAAVRGGVCEDVRLAVVGGSQMPARCPAAEHALQGGHTDEQTIEAAAAALSKWAQPHSDHHASAAYRRHLLTVILRRALPKLAA